MQELLLQDNSLTRIYVITGNYVTKHEHVQRFRVQTPMSMFRVQTPQNKSIPLKKHRNAPKINENLLEISPQNQKFLAMPLNQKPMPCFCATYQICVES